MKKISNYNDFELREEQFETLIDILDGCKTRSDLELFIQAFMTSSEKAYLGQRLNIIRMLAKGFSYLQIKEKISASNSTIRHASDCLERGGDVLKSIVLSYKFKKRKEWDMSINIPHMPGSILKKRYEKHEIN